MSAFQNIANPGSYRVIYADPPWAFETWSHRGQGKGASKHYATQGLDWLKSLPVGDIAAPNAALFLWMVQPLMPEAIDTMRAWGFSYKTLSYVWVKTKTPPGQMLFWDEAWAKGLGRLGLGYHTRSGAELVLLGTRGKGYERLSKREAQVVFAPLREHSRKPDDIAESIVRLADGPRLELFARQRRAGFDAWGNETDKFTGVDESRAKASDEAGPTEGSGELAGRLDAGRTASERRTEDVTAGETAQASNWVEERADEIANLSACAPPQAGDRKASNSTGTPSTILTRSALTREQEDDLLEIPSFLKRTTPVGRVFP